MVEKSTSFWEGRSEAKPPNPTKKGTSSTKGRSESLKQKGSSMGGGSLFKVKKGGGLRTGAGWFRKKKDYQPIHGFSGISDEGEDAQKVIGFRRDLLQRKAHAAGGEEEGKAIVIKKEVRPSREEGKRDQINLVNRISPERTEFLASWVLSRVSWVREGAQKVCTVS